MNRKNISSYQITFAALQDNDQTSTHDYIYCFTSMKLVVCIIHR